MRGTVLDASVIAQRILAGAHGHVERGSYRRVHTAVEAAPLRVSSSLGELAGRARAVCIRTAIPIGPNRTGRRRGTRGRAGLAVASHAVQLYIAPVEKVLEGHVSYPVLSALAFVPAAAVAQKPAPAPEYLPATQSSHTEAPAEETLPEMQLEHDSELAVLFSPGTQKSHFGDASAEYRPAAHEAQLTSPMPLYRPAWQESQDAR